MTDGERIAFSRFGVKHALPPLLVGSPVDTDSGDIRVLGGSVIEVYKGESSSTE